MSYSLSQCQRRVRIVTLTVRATVRNKSEKFPVRNLTK